MYNSQNTSLTCCETLKILLVVLESFEAGNLVNGMVKKKPIWPPVFKCEFCT